MVYKITYNERGTAKVFTCNADSDGEAIEIFELSEVAQLNDLDGDDILDVLELDD